EQLLPTALEEVVFYIPGPSFSPGGSFTNDLCPCFASISPERIVVALARLRWAIDRHRACGTFPPAEGADRLTSCPIPNPYEPSGPISRCHVCAPGCATPMSPPT